MAAITLKHRRLGTENSKWRVFLDHIIDESGNEVPDYLVVEGSPSAANGITGVAILAESERRFVLLRFYRHGLGTVIWDLPRGFVDAGETPAAAAIRELAEETGLSCAPENLIPLGSYAPEPGTMAVRAALFAATRCEGTLRQARDELGLKSLHLLEPAKLADLIASGEIEDAGTLIAYYRFSAWQAHARKP